MPVILMLLAAWLATKVPWLLAALAVAAAAGRLIGWWLVRRDARTAANRRHDAELCARADHQHAAVLAGDDLVGVYGEWPPAV